jgi:hypothetical protein
MDLDTNLNRDAVTTAVRSLTRSAAIAFLGLLLAGCGGGATRGTALVGGISANSTATYAALRPTGKMTVMFIDLRNSSDRPLSLESIAPDTGAWLGTVARIEDVELAPNTPADAQVASGGYRTLPPRRHDRAARVLRHPADRDGSGIHAPRRRCGPRA